MKHKISLHYFTRNINLKAKFLISHILFVLIPILLISFFLVTKISDVLISNTIRTEESLIDQMDTNISALVSKITDIPEGIEDQDFFSKTLHSSSFTTYRNTPDYKADATSFFSYVYSTEGENHVKDIKIYVDEAHEKIIEDFPDNRIFLPVSQADGSYWYGIFAASEANELFCPKFYLSSSEIENNGDLAFIQRIEYAGSYSYIAVYFSSSIFQKVLKDNSSTEDSVAYLINSRQSFVTYSNPSLAGLYFMRHEDIPNTIPTQKEFVSRILVDQKMYMGYRAIDGTDWYLVSVVPASQVYSEQNTLLKQFILVSACLVIISCLMPIVITSNITRRISTIINQMRTVRLGSHLSTPEKLPETDDRDEIGDLITTYNYMADELSNLMEQQKHSAEELRIAEYRALQAQINPHFLYNMLDMINWLSKSGKSEEVSIAVQALSKFYKLTLSKKEVTTTVSEELNHVSLYVKLQNMRFENKIDFLIDVPDEILDFEIPKLVLQPIVENAILHGILGKESKAGNIVIMAWMEGDDIVFVVSDDGIGIPQDQIGRILTGEGQSNSGSNIGIYNTHRRLQLFYDDQNFGLSYRSTFGLGTEVEVRIPAVEYSIKES